MDLESLAGSRRSVSKTERNKLTARYYQQNSMRLDPPLPRFFSLSWYHRVIYCYALHLSGNVRETISSLIPAKTIHWTPGIAGSSSICIVSPVANPFISSFVTKRSLREDNYP